jgi:three-Cys-motif partner protein
MNKFGGSWTEEKINIVEKYAKAYLTIMNKYPKWKLLYFDGFAGTGEISTDNGNDLSIEGAAKRILDITEPCAFNMYYFVELDPEKAASLKQMVDKEYPDRAEIYVTAADCNNKLYDLAEFLKGPGKGYKVLAFIDPCGMELDWNPLFSIKDLSIDLWILIPTGVGANRLLKRDGNISKAWLLRLERFFGIPEKELLPLFYKKYTEQTLFGEEEIIQKEKDAVGKIYKLYHSKLSSLFKYISRPFVIRNSKNSIMFHFLLASNNQTAVKIANSIIEPKYQL